LQYEQALSNGGQKRLLEPDWFQQSLEQMPDELIVELLHRAYPSYKSVYAQFQALLALRWVSARWHRLIQQHFLSHITAISYQLDSHIKLDELLLLTDIHTLRLESLNPAVLPHIDVVFATLTKLVVLSVRGQGFRPSPVSDTQLLLVADRLRVLDLTRNGAITGTSVSKMTQLRVLNLESNFNIGDATLSQLTTLRALDLTNNEIVTDRSLSLLTGLVQLKHLSGDKITDASLARLVHLQTLGLGRAPRVTGSVLLQLTALRSLALAQNKQITDADLSQLTALETLYLSDATLTLERAILAAESTLITDEGLRTLTALTELHIDTNAQIRGETLWDLTRLQRLSLTRRDQISEEVYAALEERGVTISNRLFDVVVKDDFPFVFS
jgi:hypothetical protein